MKESQKNRKREKAEQHPQITQISQIYQELARSRKNKTADLHTLKICGSQRNRWIASLDSLRIILFFLIFASWCLCAKTSFFLSVCVFSRLDHAQNIACFDRELL